MGKSKPPRPHNRAGVWYLVRRVPKEFEKLDPRGIVRLSTDIYVANDPRGVHAKSVVAKLNAGLEKYWMELRDNVPAADTRSRFEAAQKRARDLGLTYQTAEELADGPVSEILKRLSMLAERNTFDDQKEAFAVAGGEARPVIKLSELLDEYEKLNKAALIKKSENQLRKWRNPRKLAINYLIEVIGDKPLNEITRADTLKFKNWWQDRVLSNNLKLDTINKSLGNLSKMYKTVDRAHQLSLPPVFANLMISGAQSGQRAAFTPEFVQTRILVPGVLDNLNDEARDLLFLVAETGMRLSEACELDETTILLNANVPYVSIRAATRELKTVQSARDIPLVGVAMAAAMRHPKGFPRYRDKADSLSALVNKYLNSRGLLPTPDHSFYSFRHTFEDRLTAVEAPEKVIASLMGHKWMRPKYGTGPSLEQNQKWLQQIAFKTTDEVAAQDIA